MTKPDTPNVLELIHRRFSADRFDSARGLSEDDLRELVRDAVRAPSSFNIQHWRFVAVRSAAGKRQLCRAAYGQSQVERAAATFVLLGDTRGVERLPEIMDQAVAAGALPEAKASAWVRMAGEIYAEPSMAREEAIRSCSLAAMVMMLSAEARGLISCALTGFDPERVREIVGFPERYVPAMLLAVGYPTGDPSPKMPRLSVDAVLSLERWDERE